MVSERTYIFLFFEIRIRQLIGQKELASIVTFCYTIADRCLRLPADISVGRVKIVKTGIYKGICHAAEFRVIDTVVFHRQPHAAEAEVAVYFRKEFTVFHLCTSSDVYL
jgi:hypothetical protein